MKCCWIVVITKLKLFLPVSCTYSQINIYIISRVVFYSSDSEFGSITLNGVLDSCTVRAVHIVFYAGITKKLCVQVYITYECLFVGMLIRMHAVK